MVKDGVKVDMNPDYPYKVPREVMDDVRDNKHMTIFPTEGGFGTEHAGPTDHPMLERAPVQIGGKPATYNDLFRAVHDYYGHLEHGNGFRGQGEYNAWRNHRQMYSPTARGAMDSETLGQNSWVNNGPHAAANKGASGADTIYADQKAGLLPRSVVKNAEKGVSAEDPEITPHLTDAEREMVRNDFNDKQRQDMADIWHGSASTDQTAAMALAGKAKKGWYERSAKAIHNMFGMDAPRFTALLASLSPQTGVETNLHNTLKVWRAWDEAGRPTDHAKITKLMEDALPKNPKGKGGSNVLEAWRQNAIRTLTSEAPEHEQFQLSGPKVDSFMRNLRDNTHAVTNDSWNAIAMGIDQQLFGGRRIMRATDPFGKVGVKGPGYLGVSAKVRAAAAQLSRVTGESWTPREVQETMWSFVKTAFEHAEETGQSIPELLRNGHLTDQLIGGTPDFHQLLASGEPRRILTGSRYETTAEHFAGEPGQPASAAARSGKALTAAQAGLAPHLTDAGARLQSKLNERRRGEGKGVIKGSTEDEEGTPF
jgi:hypothetical protein